MLAKPSSSTSPRRRGIASVLAMLFLVLFAALALGFYASVTTGVQVAANEQHASRALLAAESGMQFVKYRLSALSVPPGTVAADVLDEIELDLSEALDESLNLSGGVTSRNGNVISIPAIPVNGTSTFTAALTWDPDSGDALVSVTGHHSGSGTDFTRTLSMEYALQSRTTSIFNFAIASRGKVELKSSPGTQVLGEPNALATILSASSLGTSIVTGKGTIDGDVSVVLDKSQVSLGGGSVGGASHSDDILADHVKVVDEPEFPFVDTSVFAHYATNTWTSKAKSPYKNIRIPAGSNVKFAAGDVIEGILYIESPATVEFRGHATVNGVIVFANAGSPATNVLDFRGNVSPGSMPDAPEYAAMRAATQGLAIVAPTASVTMSGSTDGVIEGSIIAGTVNFAGSADLEVRDGSIITLTDAPTMVQGKIVKFTGSAASQPPTTGLSYSGHLKPRAGTYAEAIR